jgi:hypothetical protein
MQDNKWRCIFREVVETIGHERRDDAPPEREVHRIIRSKIQVLIYDSCLEFQGGAKN